MNNKLVFSSRDANSSFDLAHWYRSLVGGKVLKKKEKKRKHAKYQWVDGFNDLVSLCVCDLDLTF